jgi:uncharacterized OB-fold protein
MRIFVCGRCGRAVFPQRLLCPDCGACVWGETEVETGVIEAIADRGDVRLATVRTALGPLAIVRVEGDPQEGGEVSLDEDGEVPVARS